MLMHIVLLSIRFKITAVTVAAILTSLLAFIVIGYYTIAKENDRTSVEKLNLLSQNAQKQWMSGSTV